jgi:mRNA interferase HigB
MIVVGREHLTTGERKLDKALARWLKVATEAGWKHFADVQQSWGWVDRAKDSVLFDILNNRYRLMTRISYQMKTVRVWDVMTHADYLRWSRK